MLMGDLGYVCDYKQPNICICSKDGGVGVRMEHRFLATSLMIGSLISRHLFLVG